MSLFLSLAGGLLLLVLGGETLVRGSVAAAGALGVSRLLIGVVLVGFGTSTPELVTSIHAALAGSPGIAVGNVVGSNIANILLILGCTALVAPMTADRAAYARDCAAMVLLTVACALLFATGEIGRFAAMLLCAFLVAYLVVACRAETPATPAFAPIALGRRPPPSARVIRAEVLRPLGLAVLGIALTMVGADLLVEGAVDLARAVGVSETVVGLTIVAVGTSLPELVSSIVAARRGAPEVAIGNVLGSNVFNLAGILGLTGLLTPITVPSEILNIDVWVMLGATAMLASVIVLFGQVTRRHGQLFLGSYGVYVLLLLAS